MQRQQYDCKEKLCGQNSKLSLLQLGQSFFLMLKILYYIICRGSWSHMSIFLSEELIGLSNLFLKSGFGFLFLRHLFILSKSNGESMGY